MELEIRLRKQFGIKECRVVLHDISCSFSVPNQGNKDLLPSNEAVQVETGRPNILRFSFFQYY